MNFAAIDIGSNTALLLIASVGPKGEIVQKVEKAEITRLGENLDQPSDEKIFPMLDERAMERTLKVLRQYTDLCHRNGVERIACIGTEALRRGHNSKQFVEQVQSLCGFSVEVISGRKEAELAYLSAMLDFRDLYPNLVVVDIGGGSSEMIWETETNGDVAKVQMVSFKMGAVRFTERYLKSDPVTNYEYNTMVEAIDAKLVHDLSPLSIPTSQLTLIGMAGTVTTLASISRELPEYNGKRVHGSKFSRSSLKQIIETLKSMNLEERKKIVGMEPKRADVILAGAAILDCMMERLSLEELVVSDHGIRYGLFYQRFIQK